MGEILFGLIMTLTFTLGAGLIMEEEGRAGARELLIATIGCNVAWGLIDGVLYVLGQLFERGRLRRVSVNVSTAASNSAATEVVAAELDEFLVPVTDKPQRDQLYASIVERLRATGLAPNRLRWDDVKGGLACGWLVFACSFPAAIPFFFIHDAWLALRVSNAVLLALLFLIGFRAGRITTANPWITGATFLVIGLILVVAAIALGG
jgi:VIT1/CCC1 family predicted Fe2+/Mn2+ transporter